MSKRKREISRRKFLEGTGAVLAVASAAPKLKLPMPEPMPDVDAAQSGGLQPGVPTTNIRVIVNGSEHRIDVEDRWSLAELLRDHLELTGTKIGCDRGECGACTVLLDGKPVYSCSNLAVWADGRTVQTVEGLAHGDQLDPLQQAFIEYDGPQCGFCTSGQLMSAKGLLARNPHPTAQEVRAGMTGNICRCSNYNHYVEAVVAASNGKHAAASGRGTSRPAVQPVAATSGARKKRDASVSTGSTGGAR
jgi:aerobic-type carbon monoxide dehydrogenase small subunit (CoxS/CutS family)